jgi:very-short-patch-repair endonuclease
MSRRPSPLATVHEVMTIQPGHVKELRGIPLTSPARTVFDLAAHLHPDRLERIADRFWSQRLLDGSALTAVARDLCKRGRAGSRAMRQIVAARGPGYVPPASALERRFAEVLQRYGLPAFRRQVDTGGGDWTGRVDFRHPVLPLIVEVQSEMFHSALVDRTADRRRREQLARDGFVVVEVWDTKVWHEPAAMADSIGQVLRVLEVTTRLTG